MLDPTAGAEAKAAGQEPASQALGDGLAIGPEATGHRRRLAVVLPQRQGSVLMQLIQHQELQALSGSDHLLIERVLPGEDVLQHHVVREQDVRRIVLNFLPFLCLLLAGVTSEGDLLAALGIAIAEILLQLFELAVAAIHEVAQIGRFDLHGIFRFGASS